MHEPKTSHGVPERVLRELADAATLGDVEHTAARFLEDIGYKHYAYYVESTGPAGPQMRGFFSNFAPAWIARYMEQHYIKDDLLHQRARTSVLPFTWLPRKKTGLPTRSAQVFSEAQDFGIRDGIAVPVHGPGSFALISAAADGGPREREQTLAQTHEAVTTLSLHVHERAAAILESGGGTDRTHAEMLTPRERECVRWVAAGRTSREIADILGIAEGTAAQHVASVRRKLQTSTRAHAAVRAMHFSLIAPPG